MCGPAASPSLSRCGRMPDASRSSLPAAFNSVASAASCWLTSLRRSRTCTSFSRKTSTLTSPEDCRTWSLSSTRLSTSPLAAFALG
eukprot:2342432-Prymnesium_polylepis.1